MSKKVKVKTVKSKSNKKDETNLNEELGGMFEEMTGVKDCEKEIIVPKLVELRNCIKKVYRILLQFGNSPPLLNDFPDYLEEFNQIVQYANAIKANIVFEDSKVDETEELYKNVSQHDVNILYKSIKESNQVKSLVILCGTLKKYTKNIGDKDHLTDTFINAEPGTEFELFSFTALDFKKLWVHSNMKKIIKTYILSILNKLLEETVKIYKIITSPDVDIDKFTEILMTNITQLKTQPGLHRCKNAFRRIEESVDLLKTNFGDYYRDSVSCDNPNIIMESFIVDVSKKGTNDPKILREFRIIIMHMQKLSNSNGRGKDPKVKKLFSILNKNFELIEKKDPNIMKPPEGEKQDDDNDDDIDTDKKEAMENAVKEFKNDDTDEQNVIVEHDKADVIVEVEQNETEDIVEQDKADVIVEQDEAEDIVEQDEAEDIVEQDKADVIVEQDEAEDPYTTSPLVSMMGHMKM